MIKLSLRKKLVSKYKLNPYFLRDNCNRPHYKFLIKHIEKLPKTIRILDACCGTGFLALCLKRKGYVNYAGVDWKQNHVNASKELFKVANIKGKVFHENACKTHFGNASFDIVCAWQVSYFKTLDINALIKEAYRLLKPRGLFFMDVAAVKRLKWHQKVYPKAKMEKMLQHFSNLKFYPLTKEKYIVVAEKPSKLNRSLNPWETWWGERAGKQFLRKRKGKPHPNIDHPIRGLIVEETAKVGGPVLDLGCGTCIDYPLFKKAGIQYTGVDLTEIFIEKAKELYPEVDAKCGDALNLPFDNESYSVLYCKDLLEHLNPKDCVKAIREMWRVAQNRIMIAFFIPPTEKPASYDVDKNGCYVNRYNKQEIMDILKNLDGFQSLEIIPNIGQNNSSLWIVDKK